MEDRSISFSPSGSYESWKLSWVRNVRRCDRNRPAHVVLVRDMKEGCGPVDQIQINVRQIEILRGVKHLRCDREMYQQGLLEGRTHVLAVVVGVVELGCDEEIFALDDTFGEELGKVSVNLGQMPGRTSVRQSPISRSFR